MSESTTTNITIQWDNLSNLEKFQIAQSFAAERDRLKRELENAQRAVGIYQLAVALLTVIANVLLFMR